MIRLQHHIRRPRPRVKLTRREIFARDRHTCQYCGRSRHDLTLDHIVPRHRGGGHTWENLVAACKPCNHRKGGKTPEEARVRLHRAAVRAAQRRVLAVHAVPRRRAQRGLAELPLPRPELAHAWAPARHAAERRGDASPTPMPGRRPGASSTTLWAHGHAAYVVGGSVRDALLGRRAEDWDLATDARPERLLAAVPRRGLREPRSGRSRSAAATTSSRSRRSAPTTSTPTSGGRTGSSSATTIEADLARRDFTVNAIAWGATRRTAGDAAPQPRSSTRSTARRPRARRPPRGRRPGTPVSRRTRCGWSGPSGSRRPSSSRSSRRRSPRSPRNAALAAHLSGERIGAELDQLLAAPRPVGRASADEPRPACSRSISPELAAQRGRAPEQGRRRGPLGPHAALGRRRARGPPGRPARRAAPRHRQARDARRRPLPPATTSSARELAGRAPRPAPRSRAPTIEPVEHPRPPPHVHATSRTATDAAVRRFIQRVGPDDVDALFALRGRTTSVSGVPATPPSLAALRARIDGGAGRRGGARPLRAEDRRHGPDARARARGRDRGWAGSSTSWSSGSSRTRR